MKKNTMKLALCGVMTALSLVLMLFEGLFPIASIAIPALAGCLLIPITAHAGLGWAFGTYGAAGLLCLLLAPDREAALIYLLFFGYYPAFFAVVSRIRSPALRWAGKLAHFNAAAIGEALLVMFVLGVSPEEFTSIPIIGAYGPVVLLILANLVFVVYDRALGQVISLYYRRFYSRFQRYFR